MSDPVTDGRRPLFVYMLRIGMSILRPEQLSEERYVVAHSAEEACALGTRLCSGGDQHVAVTVHLGEVEQFAATPATEEERLLAAARVLRDSNQRYFDQHVRILRVLAAVERLLSTPIEAIKVEIWASVLSAIRDLLAEEKERREGVVNATREREERVPRG